MNNFEKIKSLLVFDGQSGYDLQILLRSKDTNRVGPNSTLIAEWFVCSMEKFEFLEPAVVSLCDVYGARAYINLSPKSKKAVTFKLLEKCVESVKNEQYSPNRLFGSAVGNVIGNPKRWVIDVDDLGIDLDELCQRIEQCQSGMSKNVIDIIPTVNGFHIITCPFDQSQLSLPAEIRIHKNNPTLLYASFN